LIARGVFFIILVRTSSATLTFISLFFMTRYLGSEDYGSFSWAIAFVAIFSSLSDLGFSSAHIKRVSEGKDIDQCFSTYVLIKMVLICLMVLIIVFSIWIWMQVTGDALSENQITLIALIILYQILYSVSGIFSNTFIAKLDIVKSQVIMLLDPLIRVPLVIIICLTGIGIFGIAYAYIIGSFVMSITGIILISKSKFKWKRPLMIRSYAEFAIPYSLVLFIGILAVNIDIMSIGGFWPPSDVGFYASSVTFVSSLSTIGLSISIVAFPVFSKMHSLGEGKETKIKTRIAEKFISLLGLPIVVVVILFPTELASILFGTHFSAAGKALPYLAIAAFLPLLNQTVTSQIIALNRPKILAGLSLVNFIALVTFLLFLVPKQLFGVNLPGMSYEGAALAVLISGIFAFCMTRYIAFRLLDVDFNPRLILHMASAFFATLLLALLRSIIPMIGWADLIFYGLAALSIILLLFSAFKEFTKKDIDLILDVLNPKRMKKFIIEKHKR